MSTMTLEQALELGYRAGFISACNWPDPCSQDVDSPSFAIELRVFIEKHTPLTRQPEVSGEVTPEILAVAVRARNKEYTRAQLAGEPRNEGLETRAALTAVWHNRPAVPMEGHTISVKSCDGEWEGEARWEHQEQAYVTQGAVRPPVGVVSEDRAALLYLMQQFDAETWECPNCGHSEDTATVDSAYYLRDYLVRNTEQTAISHNRPAQEKEWKPYLKEGQTPFERFMQEVKDCAGAVELLRKERLKAEQAQEKECSPTSTECPRCKNSHAAMMADPKCKMHASQEKAEPVAIEGERVDLLASYLDDGGWHDEASNVRNGTDIESYEVEFRLIDWILRHCKAPPAERVRVPDDTAELLQDAWRDIAKISGSALLAGEKKSQTEEQRGIVYQLACSALAAVGSAYQDITGKSPEHSAAPEASSHG